VGIDDVPVGGLDALNFHAGTIYRWNRMCMGMGETPHLRIENRILPAGPTLIDEMANTAFWLGLMLAMPDEARNLHETVHFSDAHENFMKAARSGLDISLRWFDETLSAKKLILEKLLPLARSGLDAHKVDPDESGRLLGIIADRVSTGRTGSEWILESFNSFNGSLSPGEASVQLTAEMVARASTGKPVHEWESIDEKLMVSKLHCDATWTLEQIMDSDLITLHPDDSWAFAANLMKWNDCEHLAVVNNKEKLRGIVSKSEAQAAIADPDSGLLGDHLRDHLVTLPVDASIEECVTLMKTKGVDCVAVLEAGALAGMVSRKHIADIAPQMLNST
jgi:CBS domain-containing protein